MNVEAFLKEAQEALNLSKIALECLKDFALQIKPAPKWYREEGEDYWDWQELTKSLTFLSHEDKETLRLIVAKHRTIVKTGFENEREIYEKARKTYFEAWKTRLITDSRTDLKNAVPELAAYISEKYSVEFDLSSNLCPANEDWDEDEDEDEDEEEEEQEEEEEEEGQGSLGPPKGSWAHQRVPGPRFPKTISSVIKNWRKPMIIMKILMKIIRKIGRKTLFYTYFNSIFEKIVLLLKIHLHPCLIS